MAKTLESRPMIGGTKMETTNVFGSSFIAYPMKEEQDRERFPTKMLSFPFLS
jgi:hypothetical protein